MYSSLHVPLCKCRDLVVHQGALLRLIAGDINLFLAHLRVSAILLSPLVESPSWTPGNSDLSLIFQLQIQIAGGLSTLRHVRDRAEFCHHTDPSWKAAILPQNTGEPGASEISHPKQ